MNLFLSRSLKTHLRQNTLAQTVWSMFVKVILRWAKVSSGDWLLTSGQEAVGGQQELRGDLHLHLVLRQLEDGEVLLLPLVVGNTTLGAVVG